jgi:hypothetical protein
MGTASLSNSLPFPALKEACFLDGTKPLEYTWPILPGILKEQIFMRQNEKSNGTLHLAIEPSGKAEGNFNGQKFLLDGGETLKRAKIRLTSKENEPFFIPHTPAKQYDFDLSLLERAPLGRGMI